MNKNNAAATLVFSFIFSLSSSAAKQELIGAHLFASCDLENRLQVQKKALDGPQTGFTWQWLKTSSGSKGDCKKIADKLNNSFSLYSDSNFLIDEEKFKTSDWTLNLPNTAIVQSAKRTEHTAPDAAMSPNSPTLAERRGDYVVAKCLSKCGIYNGPCIDFFRAKDDAQIKLLLNTKGDLEPGLNTIARIGYGPRNKAKEICEKDANSINNKLQTEGRNKSVNLEFSNFSFTYPGAFISIPEDENLNPAVDQGVHQ